MLSGTMYDLIIYQPKLAISKAMPGSFPIVAFQRVMTEEDFESEPARIGNDKCKSFPIDLLATNKPIDLISRLLLSFSVYTNSTKIFSMTQNEASVTCIHGLRLFSMTWIILGHLYMTLFSVSDNTGLVTSEAKGFWVKIIPGSQYAVDTFLTISGCLLAYQFLSVHKVKEGRISWLTYYLHRYVRLTPPFILVLLLFWMGLGKHLGYGPLWPEKGFDNHCENNWWRNVLYIHNFQPTQHICMNYSWYLALEMQFYALFAPVVLLLLPRKPGIATAICFATLLSSWIISGLIASYYQLDNILDIEQMNIFSENVQNVFDNYYLKPWCRIGPYICGMVLGWGLFRFKGRMNMNKYIVILGWTVATVCALGLIFMFYHTRYSRWATVLHFAIDRTVWSLSICWLIFACNAGYGGLVNKILSWPALLPLSRLTYSAYLVHFLVINTVLFNLNVSYHYTALHTVVLYTGCCLFTYMAALPISLAFEAPIISLEKVFMKSEKKIT